MSRVALVLNSRAGALLQAGGAPALADQLRAAGLQVTEPPDGPLDQRMDAALATPIATLVVAGGDGSVACACQRLAGQDIALGILPAGTMNLLARDLGLPVDNPAAAVAVLAAGHRRQIDLGQVGPHVFACACMLGDPAQIGHHREVARSRGNGPLAWLGVIRAAARRLRAPPPRLQLRLDGHTIALRTRSLTITVNALDPATGRAFGRSVLDGGTLCAYVLQPGGMLGALRLAIRLATGSARDPALRCHTATSLVVDAPVAALRLLIDGEERLLPPPLTFVLRPRALTVIAPAGPA